MACCCTTISFTSWSVFLLACLSVKLASAAGHLPYIPPPPDSPDLIPFLRDTSMPKLAFTTYIGWYEDGGLNETVFMDQAEAMATKLRPHGWTNIMHDYNWHVCGKSSAPLELSFKPGEENCYYVDDYSRPIPALERFPSAYAHDYFDGQAKTGNWKPIVDKVHGKGLGFGLHLVVGIPKQAVRKKLGIKGTSFTADELVAQPSCDTFIPDNWQLNLSHPGTKAYYESIVELWARAGVDFVYLDGVVGDRCGCRFEDAKLVSDAMRRFSNGMYLYTSFGPLDADCTFEKLTSIAPYVRIGSDTEDSWRGSMERGFSIFTRDVATKIRPHHFGDLGGLMVGKVHCKNHIPTSGDVAKDSDCSPGPNYYIPSNKSVLTANEVISWASMFAMFRSSWWPTGVLTEMNEFHRRIMTTDAVIRIAMMSTRNRQVSDAINHGFHGPGIVWTADDQCEAWKYVLLVNLCPCQNPEWCNVAGCINSAGALRKRLTVAVNFNELGIHPSDTCEVKDLWQDKRMHNAIGQLKTVLRHHASLLVRLDCPSVAQRFIPSPGCERRLSSQRNPILGPVLGFAFVIGLVYLYYLNRRPGAANAKGHDTELVELPQEQVVGNRYAAVGQSEDTVPGISFTEPDS